MLESSARVRQIERLYRDRYSAFVRIAIGIVRDTDAAHDVVHEAFTRALASANTWREEGSLEAWLARIVIRVALDGNDPATAPLPEDLSVRLPFPDRDPLLATAIANLSSRRRTVVFLRYYADLSVERIAEILGIAEGTVSATLAQAKDELRLVLGPEGKEARR